MRVVGKRAPPYREVIILVAVVLVVLWIVAMISQQTEISFLNLVVGFVILLVSFRPVVQPSHGRTSFLKRIMEIIISEASKKKTAEGKHINTK